MKTLDSRRDFLKYMAALGIIGFSVTPLHAKVTKEAVKYHVANSTENI